MTSCTAAAGGAFAQEADTFVRLKRAQRALEMLDIQVRCLSGAAKVFENANGGVPRNRCDSSTSGVYPRVALPPVAVSWPPSRAARDLP